MKGPLAWREGDDGKFRCSHCGKEPTLMRFPGGTRDEAIDSCLVPIVNALNDAGILTTGTCCGHGGGMGNIWLDDERVLAVFDDWKAFLAVWDIAEAQGLFKPRRF